MNIKSDLEPSRTEKVAVLISKNQKYLIMAAVALVVILGAVGFVEYMSRQKEEKSVLAAESIQMKLSDYMTASDEDKGSIKDELTDLIESAKADYTGLYAHLRALSAEAEIFADDEEWDKAAESYIALADKFPKSYMAPVSLLNASSMKEESGDIQTSLTLLDRVVSEYKEVSPDIPEALFNMGRLNEGLGDNAKAQEYYNRIAEDYSSSSWNNLAKSRIIAIKAGN